MINRAGNFYTNTLQNLGLVGHDAALATANAGHIIENVIAAYEENIGRGHVGDNGKGLPLAFKKVLAGPIGLVYGRIQSGKTRAMITSTAMAFDNGFRIVVVMTSNSNDLVSQTHLDFSRELKGVTVFTKDDELSGEVENAKLDMNDPDGRILIVTSKGGKSLNHVFDFLKNITAQKYPLLIFDDEGDQASLDTNTYKRSKSGDLTLAKSTINDLIVKMRTAFPASVYVSVTGTPQSVLLQTASSDNRPSFIVMLPAGNKYIGGDFFFSTSDPSDNDRNLVSIVPLVDKARLLNHHTPFPEGLRDAIVFFLLAASAAKVNLDLPQNGKGFQFLCHPSLMNNEQEQAKIRIHDYLTEIRKVLAGHSDALGIMPEMKAQYRILQMQVGVNNTPSIAVLKQTMNDELKRRKILVINASNTKRRGIEYGPGFNFLVGGNTLGRGIAIPNLLVTYYLRQAAMSQMDTMHQHARMFGYRESTLPYTKLFTTWPLYSRFREIYLSDQSLRVFIEQHINDDPKTFPIDTSIGLNPTRRGVLDVNSIEAIAPGMQIYPNRMKLPQSSRARQGASNLLYKYFAVKDGDKVALEKSGKDGVMITLKDAIEIIALIKTNSQNTWHDISIQTVLTKLTEKLGNRIRLKYRPAQRTIHDDGFIASGTLSGAEQDAARQDQFVTLWVMDVTPKAIGGNHPIPSFIFPTIVVPNLLPRVFVFSKK